MESCAQLLARRCNDSARSCAAFHLTSQDGEIEDRWDDLIERFLAMAEGYDPAPVLAEITRADAHPSLRAYVLSLGFLPSLPSLRIDGYPFPADLQDILPVLRSRLRRQGENHLQESVLIGTYDEIELRGIVGAITHGMDDDFPLWNTENAISTVALAPIIRRWVRRPAGARLNVPASELLRPGELEACTKAQEDIRERVAEGAPFTAAEPETPSPITNTAVAAPDVIKLGPDGELPQVPQHQLDGAAPEEAAAVRATVERNKKAIEKKRRAAKRKADREKRGHKAPAGTVGKAEWLAYNTAERPHCTFHPKSGKKNYAAEMSRHIADIHGYIMKKRFDPKWSWVPLVVCDDDIEVSRLRSVTVELTRWQRLTRDTAFRSGVQRTSS